MKTTISELVNTLTRIDIIRKDLYDLSTKPSTSDMESETCHDARDLLDEYKKMILQTRVEV